MAGCNCCSDCNCGCDCKCGSHFAFSESTTSGTIDARIEGFAVFNMSFKRSEKNFGGGKWGSDWTGNPCDYI